MVLLVFVATGPSATEFLERALGDDLAKAVLRDRDSEVFDDAREGPEVVDEELLLLDLQHVGVRLGLPIVHLAEGVVVLQQPD